MIRARTSDGTFILGVTAENVRRLRDGQPIAVDLAQLGGTDKVLIVYGETAEKIMADLREASGAELPPAQPLPFDLDREH